MNKLLFDPKVLQLSILEGDKVIKVNGDNFLSANRTKVINRYRMEITLNCDLNCEYCIVHKNKIHQTEKVMNLDTAKKIVKKFNDEVGAKGSIVIIGGEPLTNMEVANYIIENALGKKIIFTNGLNMTDNDIKYFKENKVTTIISLDGYTLEHNDARFSPKTTERMETVISNIKKMAQNGNNQAVATLLYKDNIKDTQEIAKFYKTLGVKNITFAYPHHTLEGPDATDFDMKSYTAEICNLLSFSKKEKVYIEQLGPILNAIINRKAVFTACKIANSQRTFYPSSQETLCMKLDTLKNYDDKKIVDNLPINNPNCQNCIALNICGGGCAWDNAIDYNDKGVDPRLCNHNKCLVEYLVGDIENATKDAKTVEEIKDIILKTYGDIMNPIME